MRQMWTFLACGWMDEGAQDEMRLRVGEFFSAPQYGTDLTQLVIGSGSPVSGLHVPADDRDCEPAVA